MLPGMGGMNPKKMQSIMSKMGIKQEEIEAQRVIVERKEGNIIIENPNVTKVTMQGQESWQIVGEVREEQGISEEDIKLVMEKSGKSESEVIEALDASDGDIAEAIIKLSG